jgi:hypothetical protein
MERPDFALFEPGAFPLVVAGEIDVLPAERGEILEQLRVEGLSVSSSRMRATGKYSISDLAEQFSISRPTVYRTLLRNSNGMVKCSFRQLVDEGFEFVAGGHRAESSRGSHQA